MAVVGATPTGSKPRKSVRFGVSQNPCRIGQSLITAVSALIADENEVTFPETLPHSS